MSTEAKWWAIRLGMAVNLSIMAGLLVGLLFATSYVPSGGAKVNTDRPLPEYITDQYDQRETTPPVVDAEMQF